MNAWGTEGVQLTVQSQKLSKGVASYSTRQSYTPLLLTHDSSSRKSGQLLYRLYDL